MPIPSQAAAPVQATRWVHVWDPRQLPDALDSVEAALAQHRQWSAQHVLPRSTATAAPPAPLSEALARFAERISWYAQQHPGREWQAYLGYGQQVRAQRPDSLVLSLQGIRAERLQFLKWLMDSARQQQLVVLLGEEPPVVLLADGRLHPPQAAALLLEQLFSQEWQSHHADFARTERVLLHQVQAGLLVPLTLAGFSLQAVLESIDHSSPPALVYERPQAAGRERLRITVASGEEGFQITATREVGEEPSLSSPPMPMLPVHGEITCMADLQAWIRLLCGQLAIPCGT